MEYSDVRRFLFSLDPETAHGAVEKAAAVLQKCPPLLNAMIEKNFLVDERLRQKIFKTEFLNPVGLAAGFDKNGTMIKAMMGAGFGFTEIGTVTPRPQIGNPKPRLFRHVEKESIQNAMGFNNEGMFKIAKRVKSIYPFATPIGINIGKNKTTSAERALEDYKHLIECFKDLGDYLVVNISSPNTPGLRSLQNEEFVIELFKTAKEISKKPILLKIAPDMETKEALQLCHLAVESGADGIIATNTTIDYSLIKGVDFGGLSGKVLKEKSFKLFKEISKELYKKTVLISVGGIDSALEAYRRIKAGASLVQIYTALVYKGPSLPREINLGILKLLERDGFKNIKEAVGADIK